MSSQVTSTRLFVQQLFRLTIKTVSRLCITDPFEGNTTLLGRSPSQMAINAQKSFDAMTSSWLNGMMTSSNGNVFRVIGPLCGNSPVTGEFPTQRPVTRGFDVFFELRLNKRYSKQSLGWWLETPSWSLWRQCNGWTGLTYFYITRSRSRDRQWWSGVESHSF